MNGPKVLRLVGAALLLPLVAFYLAFSFRTDPLVTSLQLFPVRVAMFFDLHPLARNFPAFLVLGFLGATATVGMRKEWRAVGLVLCLLFPYARDVGQLFATVTRHFNGAAVILGACGAAAGWLAGCWLTGVLLGLVGSQTGRRGNDNESQH